jgi:hypothetical protein
MSKQTDRRVNDETLEDVCLDCCDFLNHSRVECEDCPVQRLNITKMKRKGKKLGEFAYLNKLEARRR